MRQQTDNMTHFILFYIGLKKNDNFITCKPAIEICLFIYVFTRNPKHSICNIRFKTIFHEYELTDHATTFFTIDFLPTYKGPESSELIHHD